MSVGWESVAQSVFFTENQTISIRREYSLNLLSTPASPSLPLSLTIPLSLNVSLSFLIPLKISLSLTYISLSLSLSYMDAEGAGGFIEELNFQRQSSVTLKIAQLWRNIKPLKESHSRLSSHTKIMFHSRQLAEFSLFFTNA